MARTLLFSVTRHDCEMQVFRSGGKGGQNQNKTSSGVRFIHHPSGARGESREERSFEQNRRRAFRRMAESAEFRLWQRVEVARQLGLEAEVEAKVEAAMDQANLRVEVKVDGRWVPEE